MFPGVARYRRKLEVTMLCHRSLFRVGLLLVACGFFPRLSLSEEPGFFMAGLEMKLGMSEEPLVAKLQEGYTLSKAAEHSWVIIEKQGPPYRLVGSIGFTAGRLSWISKEWGSFHDNETLAFVKELFSLLSSLGENQPIPVIVQSGVKIRQPGLVVSGIELLYPSRTISVSIVESKDNGSSVSMSEVMKAGQ